MSDKSSSSSKTSSVVEDKSLQIKLESISEIDDPENKEKLDENLKKITKILETNIRNKNHLENLLPSKFIQRDPACIRKYSNFSFPKDYKMFYDFVDYYPSKDVITKKKLTSVTKLNQYIKKTQTQDMYNDFIDTLKIVSPKILSLIDKIQELDEKDMKQYGKKFKHFIFSDAPSSMSGVKLLASALIASGLTLGYKANAKLGKTKWSKMELLSNQQLAKTEYDNFYMLCSKSVYDDSISVATKKEILGRFNERPDNVYGKNIRIILMDGGYKEGIDLFDIKYVHIFEPTLTQADQKQVIGRGTRTCGQKGLDFHPIKGWPLYVYIYDLKMEDPYDKALNATTGIEMYFKAKNLNVKLLNFTSELETTCIQSAVDYELNQNIHSFSISFDEQGESLRGGNSSSPSSGSSSSSSSRSSSSSNSKSSSSSGSSSRRSKSSSSRSSSKSSSRSSSRRSKSSSSRSSSSSSEFSIEVVGRKSNTASLNKKFFDKSPEKKVDYSLDKPLNAIEMRQYVRDYFSKYAWESVKMENNCVPKGGMKQFGGATIMNYTPTQAFVSNFFTPSNPLKGMLLWHSVGTGKTCTAIATASSSFEKQGYTILWVTRTTLKNDIWKNMFDQVCHEIIKLKIENNGIAIPSKNSDRMRLLSKSWRIRPMSYKQFSNLVSKKNQIYETMVKINGKEDPLRKTLLIIDEAHKLYGGGDLSSIETPDMVSLHASLMNSYIMSGANSVKLLLMTATPIQTDPMELVKLINLFKMPDAQMPETFDLFSQEYLNDEGLFKPDGLHKFRNEIAGHISYLNREKDARQFSQPVISMIYTDVYDKKLMEYNKKATRKVYSAIKKDMQDKLKTLRKNPILKAKNPKGFEHLKSLCEEYTYPKARTACKKVVTAHKKQAIAKLKEDKIAAKEELDKQAEIFGNIKSDISYKIFHATDLAETSPLKFRTGKNKTGMDQISSVFERLNSKCSMSITDKDKLINSAVENNPTVNKLKNNVETYNQRISDNLMVLKKEKNAETKKILKRLIKKDKTRLKRDKKDLNQRIKRYTKLIKNTMSKRKKMSREDEKMEKQIIKDLKSLKRYKPEMTDKVLEKEIQDNIKKVLEPIELKEKEKQDKKHAKTMKKMEREQKKLEKEENKKAKEHAKTMKKMQKEKDKEDKEFAKMQKVRDAEMKKMEAENKKKEKEQEKLRAKESKEEEAARKKMEKELATQNKVAEAARKKMEKDAEIEAKKREKEQEKIRAKELKESEMLAKKEAKEQEKMRAKEAKMAAKTMKKMRGGYGKTRKRRYIL